MKKFIFVFLASFIFIVGVFTPVHVAAYTADTALTGYPFVYDNFKFSLIYNNNNIPNGATFIPTLSEQNSYNANIDKNYNNVDIIRIGDVNENYIIPYSNDLYDYYFVGTYAFSNFSNFNFSSKNAEIYTVSNGITTGGLVSNFNSMPYKSNTAIGESFYFKFVMDTNSNFVSFDLKNNIGYGGSIPQSTMWFSGSVIPIPKGSDETSIMNSILQKLNDINDNLVLTNQILTQHDSNVGSWFSDLKTSMQSAFATLFGKVDSGFYALYQQMTSEQDEKLNGYDGTVASGANNEFQTGAEDLTHIEGQLNTNSTTYVNDFTSSGFDTGILTTLGSSLTFVVTWFTNFWNMGGIWTVGLSTCFAIWIAFYILRTRSK